MKRIIASLVVCVMAFTLLTGCGGGSGGTDSGSGTEGEKYDNVSLKLSCNGTQVANDTKAATRFAELVEEKSGGNVKVSVFPNDQLASGNMSKGLELVCDGTVDIDCHSSSIIANLDNRLLVVMLPWIFDDYQEAEDVFFGKGGEFIDSVVQEKGLYYLGAVHNGFKAMTSSKTLIKDPDDLKGQKMRIPGGDFVGEFYTALGASPQAMSWGEVFTALQQGTIDGHDNSLSTINSNNVQEVQPYITLSRHTYEAFTFTANKASMDKLNDATQELIYECIEEACKEVNQEIANGEEDLKTKFVEESGCELYEFTDEDVEEFSAVISDIVEKYKGIYGPEACEAFGV